MRYAVFMSLVLALPVAPSPLHAVVVHERLVAATGDSSLLTVPANMAKALNEGQDAFDTLSRVEHLVEQIVRGATPQQNDTSYANLVARYDKAARDLTTSVTDVTTFDEAAYRITADDLKDCDRRAQVRQKMSGYNSEIEAAITRSVNAVQSLDASRDNIAKARKALNYLISVNGKLSGVPIYGQMFLWNWFDLETSVRKSLGSLDSATNSARATFIKQRDRVSQMASNYKANMPLIASDCSIEGNWSGTMTASDGRVVPISFQFGMYQGKMAGNIFLSPTVLSPDQGYLFQSVTLSPNRSVTIITGGDQPITFDGTISKPYDTISGRFVSAPANGTWAVKR